MNDLNEWSAAADDFTKVMNSKGLFAQFSCDMLDMTIPNVEKSLRVLDVACGAGSLTIQAAERVSQHHGTVVAVDILQTMLDRLSANLATQNLQNVELHCLNGEDMYSLEPESFDFAYSSFGVNIFKDRQKGISEMYRLLKPGGIASISTVDRDWVEYEMVRDAFEELGEKRDIPDEILSKQTTLDDKELMDLYINAGFKSVEIHRSTRVEMMNLDTLIDFFKSPIFAALAEAIPESKRHLILPTIKKQLLEKYKCDIVPFEGTCVISIGTKGNHQ
ncbi:hypothetical protein PPL_02422 [Heterostelium album PN500]|uniref:Uncharacterized protein n=1 Tax=Heterostelium pallidum (strain ATCC 26659 / Pp 5 / PN500) TaxID=670386 RepID=D3AZN9_HETP5|nr:hypothetical protein PPL_02422 [Heterostelium album PN500]EFA85418.1 hypothetical protein PPL_02422 [Heterostelium album PN500]|eukprot:XP_020437527.1 hypothetical protein PPL_02422 [Heterostelium album PN500]